jgi:hypothetical protein
MAVRKYDRTWYSARAVAESVKTRAWRYMMRSEPYNNPEEESKRLFLADLQHILDQNREVTKELCDESATRDAISIKMQQIRGMELKERMKFYKSLRVENQRDWYALKARQNKNKAKKWFIALVVFNGLAIACALVRIALPKWIYLPTDVFAVAAASIVSWSQAKRFNELSTSYSLTAHEITIIHAQLDGVSNEDQLSNFVNDTENAFSREHTQWQARRDT